MQYYFYKLGGSDNGGLLTFAQQGIARLPDDVLDDRDAARRICRKLKTELGEPRVRDRDIFIVKCENEGNTFKTNDLEMAVIT